MDIRHPIYEKMMPPSVSQTSFDATANESPDTPLLEMDVGFSLPSWTFARREKTGQQLPQTIAHRGYKAEYPENTMGAFRGAVKVGAHAIETDIHLSKDGEVVISHDATLKRCFGKTERIIDCSWDYLSEQRTLREPHEPMPRLKDVLEYLASPSLEEIWLLLDIKLDNDASDVMRLIAKTINSIPPHPSRPWNSRIILGCWTAKYLPLCAHYLPSYPITHIGFSTTYARQFLSLPSISFNLLQKVLLTPSGTRFVRDAHSLQRPVFVWTVNEVNMMRWSIRAGVDGVITDDPAKFGDVRRDWELGRREVVIGWGGWMAVLSCRLWCWCLGYYSGRSVRVGARRERRGLGW